jgi:hypothetical protein
MASWRWHLGAGLLYGAASWLILDHGASVTRNYLGSGPDPTLIMWFLAWWPWAVAHHVHDWQTHLVWQPVGLNLAWTTSVLAGPLVTFNLLTLAAPALAGLAAYALCLELFAAPAASLIGGWLFGFSPFEASHSFDHLNLDFTCLLPLLLLVVVRRLKGRMRRPATVISLGVLIAAEFMISFEIVASLALFATLAFGLALALLPERRPMLSALAVDGVLAAPITLLLIAPQLAGMLTGPYDAEHPANWPARFSLDFLNFFVPTLATALGGGLFAPITKQFSGGLDEYTGYLGLPLIVLLAIAARQFRRRSEYKFAFVMLGCVLLATLGPRLRVGRYDTGVGLPWDLVANLPLIGAALPARFMVYAFLIISIIITGWLAETPDPRRWRAVFLVCLFLFPSLHPVSASPELVFFQPGRVEAALGPHRRLLVLPYGIAGPGSYWQAEDQFGFTQVGGYLGYPPRVQQDDPIVMQLSASFFLPSFKAQFAAYCARTGAEYVVATPLARPEEWAALRALDWKAQRIDDVTVFTVPRP